MTAKSYLKVSPSTWKAIKYIYVKVTPSTWKKVKNIYVKVTPSKWTKTFGTVDSPTQLTRPTLSGTGRVGTSITKSPGTYSNYDSIVNKIFYTTDETLPGDGYSEEVIYGNTKSTSSYTIDQTDATPPPNIFYSRDEVTGTDGVTKYYYYSDPITATMQGIEDNFNNRTTASGLGVASGGFIYSSYARSTSSWSVNGSRAVNNSNGSGYPLQTVDINSANQNVSVDTFGGGLGLAVWVSSANSWWAVIPEYSYQTTAGFAYNCTSNKTGSEAECNAVSYVSANTDGAAYTISDLGKRCTVCTTASTSYNYECTNNVRVLNAGDPCPEFESWSSAMPGGENTVCSGSCTESYEYVCASEWAMNQPDCTGQLLRPDPTGPGQLCACQSYEETVAICPSYYNNDGPCNDANFGGTGIGDQCSYCNVSTTYAYSYRDSTLTTTYQCNDSTSCNGQGCCTAITYRPDPTGVGQRCSTCTEIPSTSYSYQYNIRSNTGTTTYNCNGNTVTGSATCPTYRPDPTGVGQNCSGCTSSTNTTYPCTGSVTNATSCPSTGSLAGDRCSACSQTGGTTDGSCRSTSLTPVCPSCPGGTTSYGTFGCTTGNWRCRCVQPIRYSYSVRQTSTSTVYSYTLSASQTDYQCNVTISGSGLCPTNLPAMGTGPGQRCTDCLPSSSTTYTSYYTLSTSSSAYNCGNFTTGQSNCPGLGTGPGQRCSDCIPTTTSLYKTRIAEVQTRYKTKTSVTLTYNNYKTRNYVGSVITKSWKEVEEVPGDAYTYNAKVSIYSYSSGSLSLQNSVIISSYAAQVGSVYNEGLYPTITKVAAVTTGNTINALGYVGSYFDTTSSTNSGTKGTSVGLVSLPAVEKIGNELDNFSA